MTIQDNLNRIQQAKSDIKAAIESKGVYVDEADKIDIYASKIYEIEQGDRFNVVDIIDGAHLYNMVMYEGFAGPAVLKGTITGIDNISPEYNNATYYVDDVIKVYRGNYLEGMSFMNGDELKIGDYVVVRGTASNYNGTPQMDKYSVMEVLKHEPLLGHHYADFEDYDGEGNCWWYADEQGLDGFNYVKINASQYGQDKYNQGFADGQNVGGGIDVDSEGDGTLENPYQVGQARNIGYALEDGGISDYIHVKGYVSNIDYVNEGGTATYDLNNSLGESIKVQDGLWWHGVVPFDGPWDLEVNDIVVLKCQIEKHEPWENAGWYDVRIAPNSGVEKLEKPKVDESILNAEVLDITENGTYYTPYATEDLPEFNATLTGDDFYSYIETQGTAWDTEYQITNDSTIEFWYKTNFTKSMNGTFYILGVENGLRMKYSRNATWFTFEFGNGESFTIPEMKYEEWSHYIITKDKIIIDGVEHILPNEVQLYGDSNFLIGAGGNINDKTFYGRGYLGMVKIDGNVFIPTYKGFAASDGRLLDRVFGTHMYAYSYPFSFNKITKPISFSENLFKRVNVNVKLDIVSSGLKFSNYARVIPTQDGYTDKLPDWLAVPSKIPNLDSMFNGCMYLKDITPLSEWYTGSVTSMTNAFNGCENITDLSPLANWDVSLVTNMQTAFSNCEKLTDISPLANWDTSKVTNMQGVFTNCKKLTDISAVANWNTSKVTNMLATFSGCQNLTDISAVANWDTSNVTEMRDFFYNIGASEIPYMNCISVTSSTSYPFCAFSYTAITGVTKMGGFLMKASSNDTYGLVRYTNLDYESCINILNGLYDFTGKGETPTSSQGKLKVHKNFLDLVGDEISIGTNKGWTITA